MEESMASEREWVLLVECYSVAELHTVRATLEARGVLCQIQGEHTHGVLGPLHSAMVPPRVCVPRAGLSLARELVEDIVGPFEQTEHDADDDAPGSPYRNVELEAPRESVEKAPPLARKSWGIIALGLFIPVLPLFGLTHLYAGKSFRAGVVLFFSVLILLVVPVGPLRALLLALAWGTDVIGGSLAIADHNRAVKALEAATPDEEEDDEYEDDDDDDDDEEDEEDAAR